MANVWNLTFELLSFNQDGLMVNFVWCVLSSIVQLIKSHETEQLGGWLCHELVQIDSLGWETEVLGSGEKRCPERQCPWTEEGCMEGGWCGSWKRGQILQIRDTNIRGCPRSSVVFVGHCGQQWLVTEPWRGRNHHECPPHLPMGKERQDLPMAVLPGKPIHKQQGQQVGSRRVPIAWPGCPASEGLHWRPDVPAAPTSVGGKHICLPAARGLLCQWGTTRDVVCLQASSKSQYPGWHSAGSHPSSDQLCPAPITQGNCKPGAAGQWGLQLDHPAPPLMYASQALLLWSCQSGLVFFGVCDFCLFVFKFSYFYM